MINKKRLRIITSGMPRLDTQTHPAFPIGIPKRNGSGGGIRANIGRGGHFPPRLIGQGRLIPGIAAINPRRATEGVRGRGYNLLDNLSHSFDNFARSLNLPTFDELKVQFKQLFGV